MFFICWPLLSIGSLLIANDCVRCDVSKFSITSLWKHDLNVKLPFDIIVLLRWIHDELFHRFTLMNWSTYNSNCLAIRNILPWKSFRVAKSHSVKLQFRMLLLVICITITRTPLKPLYLMAAKLPSMSRIYVHCKQSWENVTWFLTITFLIAQKQHAFIFSLKINNIQMQYACANIFLKNYKIEL